MENDPTERRSRRRSRAPVVEAKPKPDAFHLNEDSGTRPQFGFLSERQIENLKNRAFDLLETYGVVIIHPDASEALIKAGAKPGKDADRLKMPRKLVEEALAAAPKKVSLYGKKPNLDVHLPRRDNSFIMRTGTGAHGYVDPATTKYRNLDMTAIVEMAAVASDLDQIGFIAHPFVHGVPEITSDIHGYARMIRHTDKHVWMQPYAKENVEYLMRTAAIAAGGEAALKERPITSCITCSFSPLEFKFMDTECILQAGKYGVPIHACSLPSQGGTAPLSAAGSVVMAAAEILSMLTVAYVLAPGLPVIATPLMFTLDMRTGSALQSCVESLQAAGMAVQLMKQGFGLPTHTYGSGSDTPDVDVQSMTERAMLSQTIALAGADILGGIGQLECATVFSPVQAVLDNEVGAILRQYISVPEIDDDALNYDEMASIRVGGHFLDSQHTLQNCRDQFIPEAFLRQDRDGYEATDRRTAFDQAREMALASIKNADPMGVLDETQVREIDQLVIDADADIVGAAAVHQGAVSVI